MGDVDRRGAGRVALRHRQQDAPLHARRRLRSRSRHRADGSPSGSFAPDRAGAVEAPKGAQGGGPPGQLDQGAALEPAADGEGGAPAEQRGGEAPQRGVQRPETVRRGGNDGPGPAVTAERAHRTAPAIRDGRDPAGEGQSRAGGARRHRERRHPRHRRRRAPILAERAARAGGDGLAGAGARQYAVAESARDLRQPGLGGVLHAPAHRAGSGAEAGQGARGDDDRDEERIGGGRARALAARRFRASAAARAGGAAAGRLADVQPGGHERARSAVSPLPPGTEDAALLPAGAAGGAPVRGDCAAQLPRPDRGRAARRRGRRARPAGARASDAQRAGRASCRWLTGAGTRSTSSRSATRRDRRCCSSWASPSPRAPGTVSRSLVSAEWHAAHPESALRWLERAERTALRFATAQVLAVARHDTLDRLARIRAPTLVLTGSADKLVPPVNSEVLARNIPGARLVLLRGAGHVFPLEREAETVDALREHFLGAAARKRPDSTLP